MSNCLLNIFFQGHGGIKEDAAVFTCFRHNLTPFYLSKKGLILYGTIKALQKRDAELDTLFERMKALKAELDRETDKSITTDMFVAIVRKYTRAKKLTQRMLNELVDYIEVHHAEKIDGVHVQKLKIHYNCVGSIEIPNILQPEVLIQSRKGVAVSYSFSQKVVNL
jgi:hypothetical protein